MTGASNGQINDASAPFATSGSGGVTQILPGTNITISPLGGTGIVTINSTGGGGSAPGGVQYDVQLNDGAGGFAGSNDLNFQGGYLTINGDSGYGQLQFLNVPNSAGYGGAGINGTNDQIIVGALDGDLSIWATQAINFSSDSGATKALQINTDGTISLSSVTAGSVLFAGTSGLVSQDNANFFWDDTNNRLGVGTNTPGYTLDVGGNINFPITTTSVGIIYQGGAPFISTFTNPGDRQDIFIGKNSGNTTHTSFDGLEGSNVGLGENTLQSLTNGYYNLALGANALKRTTTGNQNIALGADTMLGNTTGSVNIAISPYRGLASNTTGVENIAIGADSLLSNSGGSFNVAVGHYSARNITTSLANSAFGPYAMYVSSAGSFNTALGYATLAHMTGGTGANNVAVGASALENFVTGSNNVAVGFQAGASGGNGDSHTDANAVFVGANASRDSSISNSTTLTNIIAIGNNAKVAASNSMVLGGTGSDAVSVGIGTIAPSAFLHVIGTTEQQRIGYDSSNYYKTTVGSTGGVTFDAIGSGAGFTFNDPVNVFNTDLSVLKGNLKFTSETAPGAPTIALVTTGTGNCTNGAHRVRVTFITAQGETEGGTISSSVTVDGTHKQIALTNIPTGTTGVVTGRNIYMTKAGGTQYFRLGASPTIADNTTTTLTINIADGSLSGSTVGATNTTGGNVYVGGTLRMHFDSATGFIGVNSSYTLPELGSFHVRPTSASTIGLIVQGKAGQSVNTVQFLDSGGTVRAYFDDTNARLYSQEYTSDFTGSTGGEKFGRGSLTGSNSAAFGKNAIASNGNDVAIGAGARTGQSSFAGGESVIADGARTVALGHGWTTSGDNSVWVGGNGAINTTSYSIGIGTYSVLGDYGMAFGAGATATGFAIAIGPACYSSGTVAITMGYNAQAIGNNTLALGQSAFNNAGDNTALYGYIDHYFGKYENPSPYPINLRSGDSPSGYVDNAGSDFNIITGLGTGAGAGGDFYIKQSPPGTVGGTTKNTTNEHVKVSAATGEATFTGEDQNITNPLAGTGAIHYSDGTFTTGYTADGTTSRDYHIYAHSPAGGGIWSLAGTIANAPFVDNNSNLNIGSTFPSSGSASDVYITSGMGSGTYPTAFTTRDYQIYAGCYLNGNLVFNAMSYASCGALDNGSAVTVGDPLMPSASENSGATGYVIGDFVEYQLFSKCDFNSTTTIFSSTGSTTSTTITSVLAGIDVSWTNVTFPTPSSAQGVRILRQVNGGGYNDYLDIADPTVSFLDDNTLWTAGGGTSPTFTPDLYEVDVTWADGTFPADCTSPFYRVLRQVNSGGFNEYVDVPYGTPALNDTGDFLWSSGNTISPTSVQNFYQIDFSWAAVSGADAYKMIRSISAVDDATDLGNVTSFTDTGTLPWADPTTVTPTSALGTITSLNSATSAINMVYTDNTVGLPVYANNAAAIAGGLVIGDFYRGGGDPDPIYIVH